MASILPIFLVLVPLIYQHSRAQENKKIEIRMVMGQDDTEQQEVALHSTLSLVCVMKHVSTKARVTWYRENNGKSQSMGYTDFVNGKCELTNTNDHSRLTEEDCSKDTFSVRLKTIEQKDNTVWFCVYYEFDSKFQESSTKVNIRVLAGGATGASSGGMAVGITAVGMTSGATAARTAAGTTSGGISVDATTVGRSTGAPSLGKTPSASCGASKAQETSESRNSTKSVYFYTTIALACALILLLVSWIGYLTACRSKRRGMVNNPVYTGYDKTSKDVMAAASTDHATDMENDPTYAACIESLNTEGEDRTPPSDVYSVVHKRPQCTTSQTGEEPATGDIYSVVQKQSAGGESSGMGGDVYSVVQKHPKLGSQTDGNYREGPQHQAADRDSFAMAGDIYSVVQK